MFWYQNFLLPKMICLGLKALLVALTITRGKGGAECDIANLTGVGLVRMRRPRQQHGLFDLCGAHRTLNQPLCRKYKITIQVGSPLVSASVRPAFMIPPLPYLASFTEKSPLADHCGDPVRRLCEHGILARDRLFARSLRLANRGVYAALEFVFGIVAPLVVLPRQRISDDTTGPSPTIQLADIPEEKQRRALILLGVILTISSGILSFMSAHLLTLL